MMSPKTPDKLYSSPISKFLPEYLTYVERLRRSLYYGYPLASSSSAATSATHPSLPFTSLCVERFSKACQQGGLEILDVRTAASYSYYACPTPASLVLALLYLDRLNPTYLAVTPPSRVFLVAMMVASKYLYDDGEEDEVFNDEWATSAAITLDDLNQAEWEFLDAINWNLFVDGEAFLRTFERVEAEVAWHEGVKRGHFTYTDLVSLTNSIPSWTQFLSLVSHVLAVCTIGYTAAMVSVVAGAVLAQECTQQACMVLSQLQSCTSSNDSLIGCPNDQLCNTPIDYVAESIASFADTIDGILDEDNSTGLTTHTSPAITTLTTSILLAMSSPSKSSNRKDPLGENISKRKQTDCQLNGNCDPSDLRVNFTTGPYWPPSSFYRSYKVFEVNSEFPRDQPIPGSLVNKQKEDWVYSNPWVIPWLAWHSAPVYSTLHNFSGIETPKATAFHVTENGWMEEWVNWISSLLLGSLNDDFVLYSHPLSFLPHSFLGKVAMAHSGQTHVPLSL